MWFLKRENCDRYFSDRAGCNGRRTCKRTFESGTQSHGVESLSRETETPYFVGNWFSVDLQYQLMLENFRGAIFRVGCQNCADREPASFKNFETHDTGLHDKRGMIYYVRWTQPF